MLYRTHNTRVYKKAYPTEHNLVNFPPLTCFIRRNLANALIASKRLRLDTCHQVCKDQLERILDLVVGSFGVG